MGRSENEARILYTLEKNRPSKGAHFEKIAVMSKFFLHMLCAAQHGLYISSLLLYAFDTAAPTDGIQATTGASKPYRTWCPNCAVPRPLWEVWTGYWQRYVVVDTSMGRRAKSS